jgi:hypothetical protein
MNKLTSIIILSALSLTAAAQTTPATERKGTKPNIPGTFLLELGINSALDAPSRFDLALWGSRTVNVYYQYEVRILKSSFSFVPGIGLSLERFKFKNGATFAYDEDSLKLLLPAETVMTGLKKSQLVTNYLDIPLEFRFTSNPDDPARSFKAAVGGRIGYMYDSFAKLKYKADGETRQLKDKQEWNLNRIRYGVYTKIGIGNFALFGYYNLTPLFKEGEGPGEKNVVTDFQTVTVGISLSSF